MTKVLMLAFIGLLLPGAALACSCVRYESPEDHIAQVDVIFEGVATEIPDRDGWTGFQVSRTWKGSVPDSVTVNHPTEIGAGCGVRFTPGETYRVFAHRQVDGMLTTSWCSAPRFDWKDYEAALMGRETEK